MKTIFLTLFAIGIFMLPSFIVADDLEMRYAHASCVAPFIGPSGPCFDSFSVSTGPPLTEKSIMENYARNIELNYGDWQMSDRKWDTEDVELQLPAIICTEFVADGIKQYRMVKWMDLQTISSFESHRDDSLCDKWLPPIDDGIKLKWDKELYSSDDVAQIQVIDKDMNLEPTVIDSFDIHVFSDTDHAGIRLTVTETEPDAGYFYGNVFLTATGESNGTRLLVEDAIRADHKMNTARSKIINEQRNSYELEITAELGITTCNVLHIPIINYALDGCDNIESFKLTLIALVIIIPVVLVIIFKYKRKF